MMQTPHPAVPHQRKQQIVLSVSALLPVSRCCMYDIGEDLIPRDHVVHDGNTRWILPYRSHFQEIDPFAPKKILAKRGRRLHGTGLGDELARIQRTDYYHGF